MNMTILHTFLCHFAERVPISTYEEFQPLIERTRNGEQKYFGKPYKMVCKIKRNY
jgi:hypothetical protein